MSSWYEIEGFSSPGEYDRFCAYLRRQVDARVAEPVTADPQYGPGGIYGGRWYLNRETGEIWRLVPPDFPFRGLWERVDQAEAPRDDGSTIQIGGRWVQMPCRVKESFDLDGMTVVLLDPHSYLDDPADPKERRRGDDPLRNLRAYSSSGELSWEAEFPEPADYYYKIVSRSPLIALSFSSYRCRIDSGTGRILEAQFLK